MRQVATNRMLVDVTALRQQIWRAEKVMTGLRAYARQIGCTTYEEGALSDVIECHTHGQEIKLARWWREHA